MGRRQCCTILCSLITPNYLFVEVKIINYKKSSYIKVMNCKWYQNVIFWLINVLKAPCRNKLIFGEVRRGGSVAVAVRFIYI